MKKSEKIIGATIFIIGFLIIVGFIIYNALIFKVTPMTIIPQTVESIIPCKGTVFAKDSNAVTYDSAVIPKEINIEIGDRVKQGDLLMTVYNSRMQTIKIKSDYDGVVTHITASQGKETKRGTPLAIVASTDNMAVKLQVSESDVRSIAIGYQVKIAGDGFELKEYSGRISQISSIAEKNAANNTYIDVTVDIDNPDESVIIGLTARVYITAEIANNAVAVPYSAIEYDGNDTYVYLANDDIKKVKVTVGIEGKQSAQITNGLKIGDKIIKDKDILKKHLKVSVK